MIKLSHIFINSSKSCTRLQSLIRCTNFSSSISTAELKTPNSHEGDIEETHPKPMPPANKPNKSKSHNTMVAAAFASLQYSHGSTEIKTPFTDKRISDANTVDELLSISEGSGVSRRHALKVVSILADWSNSGKVKLPDFETDPRFIRLCRILTKGVVTPRNNRNSIASRSEDLSTVLSITADDEAAKLIGSITVPQMVKVMSTLAQKKRRSTLLLRTLAYNITGSSVQLDLKQSGDLLYSMSTLNFIDENLLTKVVEDICIELSKVRKSAVVGSIITSIGLLKYKNTELLDALSEWIFNNHALCRPQDIFSLFMTLAVLNYNPANSDTLFEVLLPQLTASEAGKPINWLEIVWSLVLLNQANDKHISSILSNDFLEKFEADSLTTSMKLKLLNIDATAQYLMKKYNGPRIPSPSVIRDTKVAQNKDKIIMVDSVIDALKNLIQLESHLQTRINTGLGFFIDAECLLDKKCNPLPLNKSISNSEATRVAIMAYDYHDMTCGRVEPTGIHVLTAKLLEAQGYKVVAIPYTEFKPRDKLVHRVQYLEGKLKEVVRC